jgi:DNA-directed RNA polymerase subunit RPC12/RpoP
MDVWNTIATEKVAKEPLLKQRRTEDQDRCGLCHELFDNREDQPCVKCTRCYLWFGFDCVGAAEMEPLVREREWRCPSCRRVTP